MITSQTLVGPGDLQTKSDAMPGEVTELPRINLSVKFEKLMEYLRDLFIKGHANYELVVKAAKRRDRQLVEQVQALFHSESYPYEVAEAALSQLPKPEQKDSK